VTRRKYLFDLASVTHIPPPLVDRLRITDFAQLIACIDQHNAQLRKMTGA
jgi:hypothetical protein